MSSYINSVTVGGRLVADPEDKGAGPALARIALNKRVKKDDEWTDKTSFVTIKAWGDDKQRLLECEKGQDIVAHGELEQESWVTKEGQNRDKLVVTARGGIGSVSRVERAAATSSNDDWKW